MHIPDGYLSPSTCAALYGGSVPFWWVAFRRVKRVAHTRAAPLLALFSAFSFIVMMFNLPLPGGTTGHAVGAAVAAIVLGPWAAIVSISVALVIQALLFGDGGITAIGANCFNMAILGSLVAYGLYTAISGGAAAGSRRRVFAAGAAGYLSINVCALAAAIELGIQPLFFRDASGAPLYAPYPLHIAIPAMMAGHLTIAGLAELVISAGVVGYLQKAEPGILQATAGVVQEPRRARRLWLAVAAMLILTPLGIRVAGSAWGEWTPEAFRNPGLRQQISAASLNVSPPRTVPAGLATLAGIWTAPLARYAPAFASGAGSGYLISALTGTGLILLSFTVITLSVRARAPSGHGDFIAKTLVGMTAAVEYSSQATKLADRTDALQRIDPRVKLAGFAALLFAAIASRRLLPIALILIVAAAGAIASGMGWRRLAVWVWGPVLLFTGAIALPAIFLAPHGSLSALRLVLRAETAATLSALLVLTTPWPLILKTLRTCGVPAIAVTLLGMSYRYIFSTLRTALEMFEARKSRTVGLLRPAERRHIAGATAGVLLSKSLRMSDEVHQAMLSRGFRGEVYILENFAIPPLDWLWLAAMLSAAIAAFWMGI